jgi:hypothetical protein
MIDINKKKYNNIEYIEDYIDLIEFNPKFNEGYINLRTMNYLEHPNGYHDFISIFNDCKIEKFKKYSGNKIIKYSYLHEKNKKYISIREYMECMKKYKFLKNFKSTSILIEELNGGGLIDISYSNRKINFEAPPIMYNKETNKFDIKDYYDSSIEQIKLEKFDIEE